MSEERDMNDMNAKMHALWLEAMAKPQMVIVYPKDDIYRARREGVIVGLLIAALVFAAAVLISGWAAAA